MYVFMGDEGLVVASTLYVRISNVSMDISICTYISVVRMYVLLILYPFVYIFVYFLHVHVVFAYVHYMFAFKCDVTVRVCMYGMCDVWVCTCTLIFSI
jgi:hypothetical protein